jgi:hypothetical protein
MVVLVVCVCLSCVHGTYLFSRFALRQDIFRGPLDILDEFSTGQQDHPSSESGNLEQPWLRLRLTEA